MNKISILESGNSDCIVITCETAEGRKTIVMDGGLIEFKGRAVLLDHLNKNGITMIDLLIVTHLHQDHHGGFSNIVDKIAIKEAILPCGDVVLSDKMNELYKGAWHIPYYHKLYEYLVRQGARIRLITECCGEAYMFGEVTLKCLYPKKPSDLKFQQIIEAMCDNGLSDAEAEAVYETFKATNRNAESSIWLLRSSGRNIAFLPGDSVTSVQMSVLDEVKTPPAILKLTHHGLKFKRLEYFNEELIARLNPEHVVVTNDMVKEKYATTYDDVAAACATVGVTPHYTLNGAFDYEF